MRRKAIHFCIILGLVCTARNQLQQVQPFNRAALRQTLHTPISIAEGIMAMGGQVHFSSLGIHELELITGISDRLAQNILANRSSIVDQARTLPLDKRYKAFTQAHGIGEKRAKVLYSVIDPTR